MDPDRDLPDLQDLIDQGVDITTIYNFSWSNNQFVDVPPLLAAILTGNLAKIQILVENEIERTHNSTAPNIATEQYVEVK
jgi:hypothetical protein